MLYYGVLTYGAGGQQLTVAWLVLGFFFLAAGLWRRYRRRHPSERKLPLWWRTFSGTSLLLFLILCTVVWGRIVVGMMSSLPPGLPYVVVLSQVENRGESREELRERLDCAVEYLNENPETMVIVSGGWDPAEGSSRAHTMYQYLLHCGIGSNRIIWETHSKNAVGNLRYSMSIAGGPEAEIGVIASDYFTYRAMRIARNLGMRNARGFAAPTAAWLWPHRILQELLWVVHDKFLGITP